MDSRIIRFLKRNGFNRMETNSYANGVCNVVEEGNAYYAVSNNAGDTIYSKDLNIYWLIGVLIYCGYIDKLVK